MAERPEDLNLPTSIVTKIIKDCLPPTCKVSKEANAAIAKVIISSQNISKTLSFPFCRLQAFLFYMQLPLLTRLLRKVAEKPSQEEMSSAPWGIWILTRYAIFKMIRFISYFTLFQFVRPLENSLAIWKKSQKDKKDSAAAKKKAGDTKSKESEENSEEAENTTKEDKPADEETEESKNDEDKENK